MQVVSFLAGPPVYKIAAKLSDFFGYTTNLPETIVHYRKLIWILFLVLNLSMWYDVFTNLGYSSLNPNYYLQIFTSVLIYVLTITYINFLLLWWPLKVKCLMISKQNQIFENLLKVSFMSRYTKTFSKHYRFQWLILLELI